MATTPSKSTTADKSDKPASTGDATVPASTTTVKADITTGPDAFSNQAGDTPDPRTGEDFESKTAGLAGRSGFDLLEAGVVSVPGVDPDRIPAEVTPGVTPNAGGSDLLAAAQAKAPNLTAEFAKAYGFGDDILAGIARGEIPPPPSVGPVHTSDLYLTPGGWQSTPPGVPPEAVGGNAISR